MDTIKDLLKDRKIEVKNNGRPVNPKWEKAKEFGDYVGISPVFILKLCKIYGEEKVYGLKSWLADLPDRDNKKIYGLMVWKLKQVKSV